MASMPLAAEGASASGLHITLPEHIDGDAYAYVASAPNAALAIAAAYESMDADTLTQVMSDLALSPMMAVAKASYRRDLQIIHRDQPLDAEQREQFALEILCARMYLGGLQHGRLPKAVR